MDQRVKDHLDAYCKDEGYPCDEDTYKEILLYGDHVHREEVSQHRWWNEFLYVTDVNGISISCIYAEANRDEPVDELGYVFDFNSIHEVVPILSVKTTYVCKSKNNPEPIIAVSKKEHDELVDSALQLSALTAIGVDSWEGYDAAMEMYDMWKVDDNEPRD